jgi:hypothetical protein
LLKNTNRFNGLAEPMHDSRVLVGIVRESDQRIASRRADGGEFVGCRSPHLLR